MDLHGPIDLLLSSLHRFGGRSVLILDPPAEGAEQLLDGLSGKWSVLAIHCRDRRAQGVYTSLRPRITHAAPWAATTGGADTILAFLPKGRELLDLTLGNVADLASGCDSRREPRPRHLLLAGHRREGIKSAGRHATRWFPSTRPAASGNHSAVIEVTLDGGRACSLGDWERRWSHQDSSGSVAVVSYPGVFSHGRIDAGTKLLLDAIELRGPGMVLDVGCGCGIIGTVLARRHPGCAVHMVDSSEIAVAAAARTAELSPSIVAHCSPSDLYAGIPTNLRFDAIVTNPPFHAGVATDHRTGGRLIAEAPGRLNPGGTLWLVANRFLPYRNLLESAFARVRTAAEDTRFTVYAASGSTASSSCPSSSLPAMLPRAPRPRGDRRRR